MLVPVASVTRLSELTSTHTYTHTHIHTHCTSNSQRTWFCVWRCVRGIRSTSRLVWCTEVLWNKPRPCIGVVLAKCHTPICMKQLHIQCRLTWLTATHSSIMLRTNPDIFRTEGISGEFERFWWMKRKLNPSFSSTNYRFGNTLYTYSICFTCNHATYYIGRFGSRKAREGLLNTGSLVKCLKKPLNG